MTTDQLIKQIEFKVKQIKSCKDNPEVRRIQILALRDLTETLIAFECLGKINCD